MRDAKEILSKTSWKWNLISIFSLNNVTDRRALRGGNVRASNWLSKGQLRRFFTPTPWSLDPLRDLVIRGEVWRVHVCMSNKNTTQRHLMSSIGTNWALNQLDFTVCLIVPRWQSISIQANIVRPLRAGPDCGKFILWNCNKNIIA